MRLEKISERYTMSFFTSRLPAISLVTLILFASCATKEGDSLPSEKVLAGYLEYSKYTDPGEFEYLYENLPESIKAICDLIKKQLVHPFDIEKFGDQIPRERGYEDQSLVTVEQMLKELLARDHSGLVSARKPENRLVVACVHHSMLLASILR
ncbi:hypothetical protein JXO59_04415, partial [candidate division KSB1 bacterium]|nr:hypothetical protein [candidate division KSB1 bacterium]